jgi:hypothetical protein
MAAYIPKDATWYLADIVEEIRVEGDPRNVVHINTILIEASSPEEAFDKATRIGLESEQSFPNPEGQVATFRFRGLRNLVLIHEEIEDGAELRYAEHVGVDEATIETWVTKKDQLSVFAKARSADGPNYASGEIMEALYQAHPHLRPPKIVN